MCYLFLGVLHSQYNSSNSPTVTPKLCHTTLHHTVPVAAIKSSLIKVMYRHWPLRHACYSTCITSNENES